MNLTARSTAFERVSPRLRITAMIDVIFLLLIFFMATTALSTPESQLTQALRSDSEEAGERADFQPQILEVGVFGVAPGFRLGERVMRDRGALAAALRLLRIEEGVFVRVEGAAPVAFVATALQTCRDVGFTKVTYVPGA